MPDKDSAAYARYVKWCKSVKQPAASIEVWKEVTRSIPGHKFDLTYYMDHSRSESEKGMKIRPLCFGQFPEETMGHD